MSEALRPIAGELGSVRGQAEWWSEARSRREVQSYPFVRATLYPGQLMVHSGIPLGPRLDESVSVDEHEPVWMRERDVGAYWPAPRLWLLFVAREKHELVRWRFKPGRTGSARIVTLLETAGWPPHDGRVLEHLSVPELRVRRWRLP